MGIYATLLSMEDRYYYNEDWTVEQDFAHWVKVEGRYNPVSRLKECFK